MVNLLGGKVFGGAFFGVVFLLARSPAPSSLACALARSFARFFRISTPETHPLSGVRFRVDNNPFIAVKTPFFFSAKRIIVHPKAIIFGESRY